MLVIDHIEHLYSDQEWGDWDRNVGAYDLIQYGCDGGRRVPLKKERMQGPGPNQAAMSLSMLERVIANINVELGKRSHCTCR